MQSNKLTLLENINAILKLNYTLEVIKMFG